MRFLKRPTAGPLSGLRKDAETPFGTIWSCFADEDDLEEVADGVIEDAERRLSVGDVVNVRPCVGAARRVVKLRVTGRREDVVDVERLRD